MGPKQTKTGLISKPKISKRHLYVKVFRISGIFKEYPSQRQPPNRSRNAITVEDRPRTALKKVPTLSNTGPSRPRQALHSPAQDQYRHTQAHLYGQKLYILVCFCFSGGRVCHGVHFQIHWLRMISNRLQLDTTLSTI